MGCKWNTILLGHFPPTAITSHQCIQSSNSSFQFSPVWDLLPNSFVTGLSWKLKEWKGSDCHKLNNLSLGHIVTPLQVFNYLYNHDRSLLNHGINNPFPQGHCQVPPISLTISSYLVPYICSFGIFVLDVRGFPIQPYSWPIYSFTLGYGWNQFYKI